MSRPRVITGVDDRGRPRSSWAPADPLEAQPYGFMEPAHVPTIERRQATPDELAAARARESEPSHLTLATLAKPVVPRPTRGLLAAVKPLPAFHIPAPAPSRAVEEEPVMPEPKPLDTFEALAEAATQASEAWAHRQAAAIAWEIARDALEATLGDVNAILHPPLGPDPDHEAAKANIIRSLREAAAGVEHVDVEKIATTVEPPAIGEPRTKRPYTRPRVRDLPLTERQEALLAAVVRLGGNRRAVAAEFGLKAHQTVDVALEVAGKKGRLPASLIPLLPARFAKYTGV